MRTRFPFMEMSNFINQIWTKNQRSHDVSTCQPLIATGRLELQPDQNYSCSREQKVVAVLRNESRTQKQKGAAPTKPTSDTYHLLVFCPGFKVCEIMAARNMKQYSVVELGLILVCLSLTSNLRFMFASSLVSLSLFALCFSSLLLGHFIAKLGSL